MIVTFKRNYDVRVCDEDNSQSGIFTFMKGKGYEAERKGNYLYIKNADNSVRIGLNKDYEKRYIL